MISRRSNRKSPRVLIPAFLNPLFTRHAFRGSLSHTVSLPQTWGREVPIRLRRIGTGGGRSVTRRIGRLPAVMVAACCCTILLPAILLAQPTSTKLSILSPAGGETFAPGDTVLVSWSGTRNRDDSVAIDLSGDNGVSWQQVAEVPARIPGSSLYDSSYRWVVPSAACRECRLRVRQVTGFLGAGDTIDRFDVAPFQLAQGERFEAIFSDHDSLLVVRTDKRIHVWDIVSRQMVNIYQMPETGYDLLFERIRFAKNDAWIVVGTGWTRPQDSSYIFVWELRSGEQLYKFSVQARWGLGSHHAWSEGAMSPDGGRIILAGMFKPPVLRLPEKTVIGNLDYALTNYSADFSPDGERIVVGSPTYLSCWNAATLDTIYTVRGESSFVQFSGDGRHILSHPLRPRYADNQSLRILDAETGDTVFKIRLFDKDDPLARFAKNSFRFIVEGDVYDLDKRFRYYMPIRDRNDPARHSYALTPNGSTVADVAESGAIVLMDITDEPTATMTASFTITGTLPTAGNRDLGRVELGQTRDTVMDGFLVNGGSAAVNVTGVTIVGGDAGDFTITSGTGPYALAAGSSAPLGVRFTPTDTGRRAVMMEAQTEFGTVRAEIAGTGFVRTTEVREESKETGSSGGLSFAVRPNPVSERLGVRYATDRAEALRLLLFDMTGRVLDRIELGPTEPGVYEFSYDVGSLPPGAYRLELRSARGGIGRNVVVVR